MIVGQASASVYLENFLILLDAPTLDNFKMLLFWQFWSLVSPLIAGPVYVLFQHMWPATFQEITIDSAVVSLTYSTGLMFLGFGNVDLLFETMMGLMPKIAINYMVSFSLLSAEASYGSMEVSLIETFSLCDLFLCTVDCTCAWTWWWWNWYFAAPWTTTSYLHHAYCNNYHLWPHVPLK